MTRGAVDEVNVKVQTRNDGRVTVELKLIGWTRSDAQAFAQECAWLGLPELFQVFKEATTKGGEPTR